MKKKILANLKTVTGGLAVVLLINSCELREDFGQQDTVQEVNSQESSGDMLVLREQKENPYSVANMQKATGSRSPMPWHGPATTTVRTTKKADGILPLTFGARAGQMQRC